MLQTQKILLGISITQVCSYHKISPSGGYELGSLFEGTKKNTIEGSHYTEEDYPFVIKPVFSIKENFNHGPMISFMHADSIRDLVGFDSVVILTKYKIYP